MTTTVGSRADGERLARELLRAGLAACVQMDDGVTSFYRWNGELCVDPEQRLLIKTLPALAPALEAFFSEHHPYELPQFTAIAMSASAAYAQWVRDEVAPTAPAPARTPGR